MENGGKDLKQYLEEFRNFHKNFYKDVRNFLIEGKLPEGISIKKLAENNKEIKERRNKYLALLKVKIKKFCEKNVSSFLREYYSIVCKFNEQERDKEPKLPFRGLVFLHSREFGEGKAIVIPFGVWENKQEAEVTDQVFNLRHSVSHILGESMWRFFDPGETKIPCLYFEKVDLLQNYPHSFYCPISSEIMDIATMSDKLNVSSDKEWHKKLWQELRKKWSDNEVDEIIKGAKEKFESWFPKGENGEGKLTFLIEGVRKQYENKDIETLLANPIRQAIISKAKNIFYIPDIHRSPITGGLVCELSLKTNNDKEVEKLADILNDLQWIFSDYVFAPISSCEIEFGSGMDFTYSQKYFATKTIFDEFKKDLLEKVEEDKVLERVLNPLRYFFESVSEERGQCVRGYKEISKKAFIAVCKLWNDLKVHEVSGGKEITDDEMKQIEANIEKFKDIKTGQPALELLWIALDFEDTLKNIPSYREHFIHSFHVFCIGLWILSHKRFPYYKPLNNNIDFLGQWFLTSLWHDVSYAMQKLADISNIFIKELVQKGYERKKKQLLVPISPSWGHLLLAEDFYKLLLDHKDFKDALQKTLGRKDISDVMLEIMLNEARHEILSGLILYHQLYHNYIKEEKDGDKKNDRMNKLIPVIIAMMLHSSYEWEWKGSDKQMNGKDFNIDIEESPLAHLLMLCDTLVQAGREFCDVKTISNDKQEIRFNKICPIDVMSQNISISLEYSKIEGSQTIEDIMKKYFTHPTEVLKEKDNLEVNGHIHCTIINKDNENDKTGKPIDFMFKLI